MTNKSTQKGFALVPVIIFIVVLVGAGIGLYLVQHPAIFRPKADEGIPAYTTPSDDNNSTPSDQSPAPSSTPDPNLLNRLNNTTEAQLPSDQMWANASRLSSMAINNEQDLLNELGKIDNYFVTYQDTGDYFNFVNINGNKVPFKLSGRFIKIKWKFTDPQIANNLKISKDFQNPIIDLEILNNRRDLLGVGYNYIYPDCKNTSIANQDDRNLNEYQCTINILDTDSSNNNYRWNMVDVGSGHGEITYLGWDLKNEPKDNIYRFRIFFGPIKHENSQDLPSQEVSSGFFTIE